MARSMLSTSDNPYNPFVQYELWREWDEDMCGYNSNAYLDRVAPYSFDLTLEEEDAVRESGIAEILEFDFPIFSPFTKERVHYIRVEDPNDKE